MKVVLARSAGACYGVQRALDLALSASETRSRVCTLGPLIHNPQVVEDLAGRNVRAVERIDQAGDATLVIRSHGVVPDVLDEARASGLNVIDATCPHVARAQRAAARLARGGCRVLVVGEPLHPEVEGLRAYAEREGARVDIVASPDEVPPDLSAPVGIVVQTTQRRENLVRIVEAVRDRGIEPAVEATICSATRQRQDAAAELAGEVDAMVVIGGRNSSNTTRLAEICGDICRRAYHVESVGEIVPEWFDGCETAGVTAGASTPADQIEAVVRRLEAL